MRYFVQAKERGYSSVEPGGHIVFEVHDSRAVYPSQPVFETTTEAFAYRKAAALNNEASIVENHPDFQFIEEAAR